MKFFRRWWPLILWLLFFLTILLYLGEKHYPETFISRYGLIATFIYLGLYAIGLIFLAFL